MSPLASFFRGVGGSRSRRPLVLLCVGLALAAVACRAKPEAPPRIRLLVVGVDGADPEAIGRLVAAGDLPTTARLIERGSFLTLKTGYTSASPVVWTTMVTGVGPEEHGIRDFVIRNGRKDLPLTSEARLRPALWNMLDRVGRRGAFLGLWATWPAEQTAGLILSDRARYRDLPRAISPRSAAAKLRKWRLQAEAPGNPFPSEKSYATGDQLVNLAALEAVADPSFDVVFAYFKTVDAVSHNFWHLFEPEAFPGNSTDQLPSTARTNPVRDAYKAIDGVIEHLLANAPAGLNTIVVSDHGFMAQPEGAKRIHLNLDPVLEALGFLRWTAAGPVDTTLSQAWTFESPDYSHRKRVRVRAGLAEHDEKTLVARLRRDLATCRFDGGGPAFDLRLPDSEDRSDNVVLEVVIESQNATKRLLCRDREIRGAVGNVVRPVSGGHNAQTDGILIVNGPIFARGAAQPGASIGDIGPTILYALGLPVARDFIGKPLLELFTPEFRRAHPLRKIDSWGKRNGKGALASNVDQELIDDLAALGYLK